MGWFSGIPLILARPRTWTKTRSRPRDRSAPPVGYGNHRRFLGVRVRRERTPRARETRLRYLTAWLDEDRVRRQDVDVDLPRGVVDLVSEPYGSPHQSPPDPRTDRQAEKPFRRPAPRAAESEAPPRGPGGVSKSLARDRARAAPLSAGFSALHAWRTPLAGSGQVVPGNGGDGRRGIRPTETPPGGCAQEEAEAK